MENDQLTFGIDFDGTLARDPKLFGRFIRMLHRAGHVAVLVTGRSDMTPHAAEVRAVMAGLPEIPLVFAGPNWKRHAAKEAGHEIDIWVDDRPEYIGPQDPEAPMVQIRSAAETAHTGIMQWAPHRPSEPGDYWVALAPENRKAMGCALGMLPPPVLQVWSLGDGSILSAFWWEDQALEDAWLEGARWMPRLTPDDPFIAAEKAQKAKKTTTRVQVIVEVIDAQPWSPETTVGDIYKRAKEHARMQVQNAIQERKPRNMQIVGDPLVSLVMTEDKS